MKILSFLVKLVAFAVVGAFLLFICVANALLGAVVWLPLAAIYGGKAAFDFIFKRNSDNASF